MSYIETTVLAVSGMIAIVGLIMGLDNMIRIVLGNYLINSIILGFSNFIELISASLSKGISRFGKTIESITQKSGEILLLGKPTLLLTAYFLLLYFLIKKSHIGLDRIQNDGVRLILTILFVPCTVISVLAGIATALFGNKLLTSEALQGLANVVAENPYFYKFVLLTPLRLVFPGIMIIIAAGFSLRHREEIVQKVVTIVEDHHNE